MARACASTAAASAGARRSAAKHGRRLRCRVLRARRGLARERKRLPGSPHRRTRANRLSPWPVSFRYALLAIAPQPGAPVGALASEALAVGDHGEVARYEPGHGLAAGKPARAGRPTRDAAPARGRVADAGSAPSRSADLGQMWLWRGETGLWEPDPATPLNFRGNLLGIAFDPTNSARGYAVGAGRRAAALRQAWTQEPEEAIPAEARGRELHVDRVRRLGGDRRLPQAARAGRSDLYSGRPARQRRLGLAGRPGRRERDGRGRAVGGRRACPTAAPRSRRPAVEGGAQVFERQGSGAELAAACRSPAAARRARWRCSAKAARCAPLQAAANRARRAPKAKPPPPPGFPPNIVVPYPLPIDPEHGVVRADGERLERRGARPQHRQRTARRIPLLRQRLRARPGRERCSSTRPADAGLGGRRGRRQQRRAARHRATSYRYPADGAAPRRHRRRRR